MIKVNIKCKQLKYIFFSVFLIFSLNYFRNYLINLFEISRSRNPGNISFLFIKVVFLGPLKEEILFRSLLIINCKNLFLFSITLVLSLVTFVYSKYWILVDLLIIILSLLFYKIYTLKNNFHINNFYMVVIFSLLFWFFHLWNYENLNSKLLIATVPIFFSGIVLSYLRLKFNLLTSLITHILYNLIAYLIYIY
jgi:membrane protease YdiL (CAAX protease family)